MMPACPHCDAPVSLSSEKWQSREQGQRNVDNYICKAGHEFEAPVPLTVCSCSGEKHAIRADI